MITSNINEVMRAVNKATSKLDIGAREARDEMMNTLIQFAKEEIKGERYSWPSSGKTRYYAKAEPGQPPMNRTGNLRRSIRGEKYRQGFATYSAVVGPTIVYGRSVEMGGKYAPRTWSGETKSKAFPYMQPAFKKFQAVAYAIMRKHLSLRG